jgi:hypothetical protein
MVAKPKPVHTTAAATTDEKKEEPVKVISPAVNI